MSVGEVGVDISTGSSFVAAGPVLESESEDMVPWIFGGL